MHFSSLHRFPSGKCHRLRVNLNRFLHDYFHQKFFRTNYCGNVSACQCHTGHCKTYSVQQEIVGSLVLVWTAIKLLKWQLVDLFVNVEDIKDV